MMTVILAVVVVVVIPSFFLGRFLAQGLMLAGQWFVDGLTAPSDAAGYVD